MFFLIKESIINSKYVISKMNKTSSNTLFYNLLSSNDDTHCHDFYNYVCCNIIKYRSKNSICKIYSSDTGSIYTGSISNYERKINENSLYKNGDNHMKLNSSFKIIFDLWLNSVITYEILKITSDSNPNMPEQLH